MTFYPVSPFGAYAALLAQQQLGAQHGGHLQAYTQAYGYPFIGTDYGAGNAFTSLALYPAEIAKPVENAGIRAGEITAWRCWNVIQGEFLSSIVMGTMWAPGDILQSENPPGDYDSNGVHAWKTAGKAMEYALHREPVAVGTVKLWGEVVEHEHGYRAEYAKIASIDYILNKKWRAKALRKKLEARYCP